jgi:hypothetical protein
MGNIAEKISSYGTVDDSFGWTRDHERCSTESLKRYRLSTEAQIESAEDNCNAVQLFWRKLRRPAQVDVAVWELPSERPAAPRQDSFARVVVTRLREHVRDSQDCLRQAVKLLFDRASMADIDLVTAMNVKLDADDIFLALTQVVNDVESEDSALDLIYDVVDDLMHLQRIDELNNLFATAAASSIPSSLDLQLGLLTASFPMKECLPRRIGLIELLQRGLIDAGEDADQILKNLWP